MHEENVAKRKKEKDEREDTKRRKRTESRKKARGKILNCKKVATQFFKPFNKHIVMHICFFELQIKSMKNMLKM